MRSVKIHTCELLLQKVHYFVVECVHVIALCVLHVAFLRDHPMKKRNACTTTSSSPVHAVYSAENQTVSSERECTLSIKGFELGLNLKSIK